VGIDRISVAISSATFLTKALEAIAFLLTRSDVFVNVGIRLLPAIAFG
jgi:hypothetical protein